MKRIEHRQVIAICKHVLRVAKMTTGTANTEVLQQPVARMQASLRKGQYRQAEDLAYGILIECQNLSKESGDEEAAEGPETSKTPHKSVDHTVNIGRSIKFIRVAAGIKQGKMAGRLDISQNYLSLLENNKAEPSLSLLRRIASEFHVPMSFLFLEDTADFESDEPEMHALLQELQSLIHNLQRSRIKEGQGTQDGASSTTD